MASFFCPTTLRSLLKKGGAFPKKSLSQNFLVDGNIVRKIIDAAKICPEETVLEVGAGSGILTESLLEKKAHVIAVEKDTFFADHLSLMKKKYSRLEVFEDDFLKFSLEDKISKKIKVVSNLPYNITSELFLRFFELSCFFTTLILMVQKEAAHRILSRPGTKNYGPLSLFTHYYTKPRKLFDIPATCFYPSPKVDSTLLELQVQKTLSLDLQKPFHHMVAKAFQQRRKKITSSLKELYPQELIQQALFDLCFKQEIRPEELSAADFFRLFELLFQRKNKKTLSTDEKKSETHPLLQKEEFGA